MKTSIVRYALGAALFFGALPVHAGKTVCDDPRPLRIALIPKNKVQTQFEQYRPLIEQLEARLERKVELVSSSSYAAVIEGLLADSIDLAELGPASYVMAINRGADILAFAAFRQAANPTNEAGSYRSLLLTRRAAKLDTIEQLRGATLSLTDPASTSGAILPRYAMQKLTGTLLENHFQRVSFSGSHDRAIEMLRKGQVDAVFVSSSRVREAIRQNRLHPDEIRILWRSPPIPYDPFVHRKRLCPALKAKIDSVFFSDTRALQAMFDEFEVAGFAPVSDAHYRQIHEIFSSAP